MYMYMYMYIVHYHYELTCIRLCYPVYSEVIKI